MTHYCLINRVWICLFWLFITIVCIIGNEQAINYSHDSYQRRMIIHGLTCDLSIWDENQSTHLIVIMSFIRSIRNQVIWICSIKWVYDDPSLICAVTYIIILQLAIILIRWPTTSVAKQPSFIIIILILAYEPKTL